MENELYHHGVLGMKWGVRRYQNKDGTLTERGRRKLAVKEWQTNRDIQNIYNSKNRDSKSNIKKMRKAEKTMNEIKKLKMGDVSKNSIQEYKRRTSTKIGKALSILAGPLGGIPYSLIQNYESSQVTFDNLNNLKKQIKTDKKNSKVNLNDKYKTIIDKTINDRKKYGGLTKKGAFQVFMKQDWPEIKDSFKKSGYSNSQIRDFEEAIKYDHS